MVLLLGLTGTVLLLLVIGFAGLLSLVLDLGLEGLVLVVAEDVVAEKNKTRRTKTAIATF